MAAAASGQSITRVSTVSRANADFGCSSEFEACMQRLRSEVDVVIQRHCNEMQHSSRLWAARQSGAWRSADTFSRSSSSVDLCASRREVPGVQPETPKLDPPPSSHTPVHAEPLRRLAKENDRLTISEVLTSDDIDSSVMESSTSSTRCDSRSGTDCLQHVGEDHVETTVIGAQSTDSIIALPLLHRRPSAAWIPSPGEDGQDPPLLKMSSVGLSNNCISSEQNSVCRPQLMRMPTLGLSENNSSSPRSSVSRIHGKNTPSTTPAKKRRSKSALFSPLSKRKLEVLEVETPLFEQIARSRVYESINAVFIALNAIFILWETEKRASLASSGASVSYAQGNDLFFVLASNLFVVIFIVDIILRFLGEGCNSFLFGRERAWNVFDVFVTFTAAVEVLVQWVLFASSSSESSFSLQMHLTKFSMLRIVRLLRVIQTARAVRMVRFIRELRLMVMSLGSSLKPLLWSVVLMLIIMLIFGVFFTDGAVAYCVEHDAMDKEETRLLRQYFGTLWTSTLSLYMSITGGEDWAIIFNALDLLPMEYRQLFLVFVTFATLAVLNVVTAVFVGTAMYRSQHDTEMMIQQELESKDDFVSTLHQVFDEMDADNSGSLTAEEFAQYIGDEKIMAYLRTLEINIDQAHTLFTLLDVDGTGEVDIDEFATGLARLKGGATSIDMAVLKYQVEWIHHNVMQLHMLVSHQVSTPRVSKAHDNARVHRRGLFHS